MADEETAPKRDLRFWLIFFALCLAIFVSAIDLGSMATALPSIVHNLNGTESFAWVSAAYTLATTAVLPLNGRLAEIFGRRNVLLFALFIFAVGSGICAGAQSMAMLIAGRAVQGLGSGGIQTLTTIVVSDLVPLKERGLFNGVTGATFTLATGAGPFIGGAIVQKTTWRWLFYINLPLSLLAFGVVFVFLKLKTPPHPSLRQFMLSVDWIGNFLIICSTTSCIIALTWAGVRYPWSSFRVIVPLVIGMVGLCLAILYETLWAKQPMVPLSIISNRTSLSGYFGSIMHAMVITSVNLYLPVYFQAAKASSPLAAGIYVFAFVIFLSPAAIVQGVLIGKYGNYRLMNAIGWAALLLGVALLLILKPETSIGVSIPFQIIASVGLGFLYATTFSVLAPLDVSQNAAALSFLLFCRTFPQSWSIAIGATILQNQLRHRLPASFIQQFTSDQDIAYVAIPLIRTLPEPLQSQCRLAFSESLHLLWKVLTAFCAAGLLSVFLQKGIKLHGKTDKRWGMEDDKKQPSTSSSTEKAEVAETEDKV